MGYENGIRGDKNNLKSKYENKEIINEKLKTLHSKYGACH
jgi:hypothetical protein